jgi:putative nucleotidyltransferase with HDIG domain
MNPKRTYWTNGALSEMADLLVSIQQSRDHYGAEHAHGVADESVKLARYIRMSEKRIEILRIGALLHDIGKLKISDFIIEKAGALAESEFDAIKHHPQYGVEYLKPIHTHPEIAEAIYSHHENWDGTGYPDGLKGKDIPVFARIVCVCDRFDALVNYRHYRVKVVYSIPEALMQLRADEKNFDPALLLAFIRMKTHKGK